MTLEEDLRRRIGQLVVFGFDGKTVSADAADLIQTHYLGNVILFNRNVESISQLQTLTRDLQGRARDSGQAWPLTISADQENGIVRRMPEEVPVLPGNMALGATQNVAFARSAGELTARMLLSLGINFNLAPVLDVNNNPDNPVIGVRSFSDQAQTVASFGTAMIEGLQSHGVIACGKHFPGHGDTNVDSHRDLPTIVHGMERLHSIELQPFRAAIDANIDVLMTAHVVFLAVEPDKIPATLSRRVLTELLREELGFKGVITTDCLEMNAISETVGVPAGAVQALKAGADLIMVSHRLDRQLATINAVMAAVRSGELSERRIDDAYQRVIALKSKRLSTSKQIHPPLSEARALQRELSEKAVTRLTAGPILPCSARTVAILTDQTAPLMVAAGRGGKSPLIKNSLAKTIGDGVIMEEFSFPSSLDNTQPEALIQKLKGFDVILAAVNGTQNDPYMAFLDMVQALPQPKAMLLLRSPYDAGRLAHAENLFALYENTPWMAEAALRAVFGGKAEGSLPVKVSDDFPRGHRA